MNWFDKGQILNRSKVTANGAICQTVILTISFFFSNFIFKLYIIVLVLPNIKMNPLISGHIAIYFQPIRIFTYYEPW